MVISLIMKKLLHSQKTVVYTNYNIYKILNISEQCIAVQYIAVHCKSTICYTVKFNESRDLNCCALQLHIFLKLFSEVHCRGKKCSVKFRPGLCQRVHSSPPPLNQIPWRRRKILVCFFSVSVILLASVERFGVSRMRELRVIPSFKILH
jgi:hypothetical protein